MASDNPKPAFSFGFSKKKGSNKLKSSAIKDEEILKVEEKAAFVDSFDGKQLNRNENTDLVIPLISVNRWKNPVNPDDLENDGDDEPEEKVFQKVAGNTIESEAANELLREAAGIGDAKNGSGKDSAFTVPLMAVNRAPEGYETDDRLDVSLRPEGSVAADYTKVPIEAYGLGMLRGMGWKEGTGIGKKGKLAKPVAAVLRPKGMGLGADRNLAKQMKGDSGDNVDPELAKLTYTKDVHCVITNGRHKDLYGTIEGTDEDNSRVVVKMTLSGESITISQYAAKLVTKKDYNMNSKVLNKAKVDKYKEDASVSFEKSKKASRDGEDKHGNGDKRREDDRDKRKDSEIDRRKDRDRDGRDRDGHRDKEKKRKHESSSSSSSSSSKHQKPSQKTWMRTHLRVRIIDPEYKKGKYFKTKMVIEDVIGAGECICRTDDGRVLEGIRQDMLETVIPRSEPGYVMIISGKHRSKLGQILRKDKSSNEAVVQLLEDRDVALTISFDDICDYTGNIDDEFNY